MAIRTGGVHRIKVSDSIVEHITSLIMSGELKAGDKLPAERELALSLGVSRTALREAVRTLSLMDLLSVKQGGGTFVTELVPGSFMKPLSPMLSMGKMNILELIEARRIIEPKAASLCAGRSNEKDIAEINGIVDEMRAGLKSMRRFNDLDLMFHMSVAKGAHNSVISATLDAIKDAMYEQVQEIQSLPGAQERALLFHSAMAEAITARDCAKAEKLMLEHMEDVEKTAKRYMAKK